MHSPSTPQHVAVDINDDALEMARAAYPHLTFERGSVLGLPFSGRTLRHGRVVDGDPARSSG
jgi:hypothetical protein